MATWVLYQFCWLICPRAEGASHKHPQAMSALMGVDSHSMTAPAPLLASIKFHLEIERMRLLGPQMETPLASQPQQFYYEGVPAWLHQPMHHHQQQQYAV